MVYRSAKLWYKSTYDAIAPHLSSIQEAQAVTLRLLQHYLGYSAKHYILDESHPVSAAVARSLATAIQRLTRQEPLQYVLGGTHFCGYYFKVTPDVLIPRPETEEMVMWIIKHYKGKGPLTILDVGTGSGCIAITLAKAFAASKVEGLDKSKKALAVAQANASALQAPLTFRQANILTTPLPEQHWDMIVSNPPYVLASTKATLECSVVDYEPAEALFVPDERPLLFYERLAAIVPNALKPGGSLLVEINEIFGEQIVALFSAAGFAQVTLYHDLHGKARWVVAQHATLK